jgi:hypothetical protein
MLIYTITKNVYFPRTILKYLRFRDLAKTQRKNRFEYKCR